ncbi:hypothetical protein H6P81_008412 [Aristolochia fimbriata]|uniref:RRM domain-containing protein n=1 Tax=Aristolochia fimbriata TaxID=158543 RepID=A0AAV7EHZ1_ARIFI|nr:hypothetical protein H6P81_008412 [Aristolochia fimbriata]
MDASDQTDKRTFRVNFSGDGAARLRETVREKLKEFMGDYTDDTLVEYVIVLLRNGRHKQEAENELNVFLEEGSAAFVSWLWDHLSSSLHLYVQPEDTFPDEAAKTRPILDQTPEICDGQKEAFGGGTHSNSDYDGERPVTKTRSRRNREWKGLVRDEAEPPPLRSIEIDYFHPEKKSHQRPGRSKQSRSPVSNAGRKRTRQDERWIAKKEMTSDQPSILAPRRLLQFAVRDAVSSLKSPSLKTEPTIKRLRSVVATNTEDSLREQLNRTSSISRGSAHALAMRAAREAAQDVINFRNSGNVFDRLGNVVDRIDATNESSDYLKPSTLGDGVEYGEYLQATEYHEEIGDAATMERETGLASESASENDEYDDVAPLPTPLKHRIIDSSQSVSSANKKDSLMVRYSVAQNANEVVPRTRMKDLDQSNNSRKIVNISVNVNTWKPPHYQSQAEVKEGINWPVLQKEEVGPGKSNDQPVKGNMAGNHNKIARPDSQQEPSKNEQVTTGSLSAVCASDDTESRTIFVNNVHFAATKDLLSRHFNKFGEVLKVIIVTDAATGQPKGSAYIEFMRKEAADLAISLNGTSFMSRVLKVVKRNTAQSEAGPVMGWSRAARASPFNARLGRMPFPRGSPGGIRGRFPLKIGPRSLQWKRETASNPSASAGGVGTGSLVNNVPSPTSRSLTYVRPESK